MSPSPQSGRRVLMNFHYQQGWRVSFLEDDCRTPLPRRLCFASEEKIKALYDKCGSKILEDRQALEMGLANGRGGAWLRLSESQYRCLHE